MELPKLPGKRPREVMGKVSENLPGSGSPKMCQRCNQRPAEFQFPGWLPICKVCNDEILNLPFGEMLGEMKSQWDKFTLGGT